MYELLIETSITANNVITSAAIGKAPAKLLALLCGSVASNKMAALICNLELPVTKHVERVCVGSKKSLLSWRNLDVAGSSVQCCVGDSANHRVG